MRRFTPRIVSKRVRISAKGAMVPSIRVPTVSIARLVQAVEVGKKLIDEEDVVSMDVAAQGLSHSRPLRAQLAGCEIPGTSGSVMPGHQRLELGLPGGAEQARGGRGELDPGLLGVAALDRRDREYPRAPCKAAAA